MCKKDFHHYRKCHHTVWTPWCKFKGLCPKKKSEWKKRSMNVYKEQICPECKKGIDEQDKELPEPPLQFDLTSQHPNRSEQNISHSDRASVASGRSHVSRASERSRHRELAEPEFEEHDEEQPDLQTQLNLPDPHHSRCDRDTQSVASRRSRASCTSERLGRSNNSRTHRPDLDIPECSADEDDADQDESPVRSDIDRWAVVSRRNPERFPKFIGYFGRNA